MGVNVPIGKHKIFFRTEHAQIFSYKIEPFPSFGLEQRLDDKGFPRWRNTTTFGYSAGVVDVAFTGRSIASHKKEDPKEGDLPRHLEWDFHSGYNAAFGGKLALGVKNFTNRKPPEDETAGTEKIDSGLYDIMGRTFYVGYTQTF